MLSSLRKKDQYLPKYFRLREILALDSSARCWESIDSFCRTVGQIILDYNKTIRQSTRKKLQNLNFNLNNSKFLTNHIVVCSVYRLRYELRKMNERNFEKIRFLWNMEKEKLRVFWKNGVVDFDKDYELSEFEK